MHASFVLAAGLLALTLAGCSTDTPEGSRAETLAVTFHNQPDREFGDLLDESLTISYWLDPGQGPSKEVQVAPGETATVEFDVAGFDEFVFESHARSTSGTSSGWRVPLKQAECGHFDVIHVDLRYYAKLTAGAWSWGGDVETDCP